MANSNTRKPPNDAVLILRINEGLRERFARQAFLRDRSVSEAVREAMEQWMGVAEMEDVHATRVVGNVSDTA